MNVNKKNKQERKRKRPLSKDEKTLWICSLFVSMLFLFFNFQQQQSLLDIVILCGMTMSLLVLPLICYGKLFIP